MNARLPRQDRPFRVGINGRFLSQKLTGVQRYAHEIVTALGRRHGAGWFADGGFVTGLPANAAGQAQAGGGCGGGRQRDWDGEGERQGADQGERERRREMKKGGEAGK